VSDGERGRTHLLLCDGPSCGVVHESERLVAHVAKLAAEDPDIAASVRVWSFTCFGLCDDGPNGYVCPSAIAPPSANNAPEKPMKPGVAQAWPAVVPPRGPGGEQLTGLDEEAVERVVKGIAGK
jgi:hypothetical protein